jgi:hypothetical protein
LSWCPRQVWQVCHALRHLEQLQLPSVKINVIGCSFFNGFLLLKLNVTASIQIEFFLSKKCSSLKTSENTQLICL